MALRFGCGTILGNAPAFSILLFLALLLFVYFTFRKKYLKKEIIIMELITFVAFIIGLLLGILNISFLSSDSLGIIRVAYIIILGLIANCYVLKIAKTQSKDPTRKIISKTVAVASGIISTLAGGSVFIFSLIHLSEERSIFLLFLIMMLSLIILVLGILTVYYGSKIKNK